MDWQKDEFSISDDPAGLDVDRIHGWLSGESYWAKEIPRKTVEASIAGALCFGIYLNGDAGQEQPGIGESARAGLVEQRDAAVISQRTYPRQIGFARVITDRATFAYLADVFVDSEFRGRGLSKWLMEVIVSHPQLQGLRNWMLQTQDAQGLYAQFGFKPHPHPERVMTRADPDVYKR